MSNDLALSHLFCENHPSDAASILVRLPTEFVAGFLSSLPPARGIDLIRHMPTAYATQLLGCFAGDHSARLLAHADFSTAARLLRPLPAWQRDLLMAEMNAAQTEQLSRILHYPPGSVGNLVEIPVFTGLGDWSVKHSQREIKRISQHKICEFPVVDHEHRYLGSVSVHALLSGRDNRRLDELCEAKELALPSHSTIASVIHHPVWNNSLSIAVIDRAGILLGLLHRSVLNAHIPGNAKAFAQDALAPVMALAELYWAASSSIISLIGKKSSSHDKK